MEVGSTRDVLLGGGAEFMRLSLQEAAGQTIGFIQFSGNEGTLPRRFDVLEVKREGRKLTMSFDSGQRVVGSEESKALRESLIGELESGRLNLVYQLEGHGGVAVVARRIAQSAQIVDGLRAGYYTYKGDDYPDVRSACMKLLHDVLPYTHFAEARGPNEYGYIDCVGTYRDGSVAFNPFNTDVREAMSCPPKSRLTLVFGAPKGSPARCECDGDLRALNEQCVTP